MKLSCKALRTISRQKQLSRSTHLMKELLDASMELMDSAWKYPNPIRLLSVTAIHLTAAEASYEQVDLFSRPTERRSQKQEKIEQAMDAIRGKYGKQAIAYGAAAPEVGKITLPDKDPEEKPEKG